jgi:hypothetical protein
VEDFAAILKALKRDGGIRVARHPYEIIEANPGLDPERVFSLLSRLREMGRVKCLRDNRWIEVPISVLS